MCLVCTEYSKQKITAKEALRNLGEMRSKVGEEHYKEVYETIYQGYIDEKEYWDSHYYELLGFGD